MKFRHKKIKREHSIIKGALSWLEDLSKNPAVNDIIPGVIDVTHSPEKGVVYKYETDTGCKLLLKSGGSIQEAFVVTKDPKVVKEWAEGIMGEISMLEASLDETFAPKDKKEESPGSGKTKKPAPAKKTGAGTSKSKSALNFENPMEDKSSSLLSGISRDYQLVEINKGLRDSYVESLASMADLEDPKLEEALDPSVRDALKKLQKGLK